MAWLGVVPVNGKHVSKEFQVCPSEVALLWGAGDSIGVESLQDEPYVACMRILVVGVDDDVIEVGHTKLAPMACQHVPHQVLEGP